MDMVDIARRLKKEVSRLEFGTPVTHVYNPLDYAWPAHREYLRRYGSAPRKVLLVGMNPGPWGMAQTGVPFGDVPSVRDWMEVEAPVAQPSHEHSRRPVLGFACRRRETSGRRLWGWARDTWGSPQRFFRTFFVVNYCPLAFFEADGKNRTPDKLPAEERRELFAVCDAALARIIGHLRPGFVIGVGRFAEQRAMETVGRDDITVASVTHPSPANPAANRGWDARMNKTLAELGIRIPE